MLAVLVSSVLILLLPAWIPTANAGQEAGNGGDTVECSRSTDNDFVGTYALDYLLTYKASTKNSDIVSVGSVEESIQRIRGNLEAKVPELMASFDEFSKLIRNEEVSLPRFWEEAPFGLVDIKDEEIINLVPDNCRLGGVVKITQAIIRLKPAAAGTAKHKLIYKFVPGHFEKLATESPLQLSFLLIHEWLWDVSHNVERNRRLNRLLHSDEFDRLTRTQLRSKLTTLGLEIPKTEAPKDFRFDNCPADPVAAKQLMQRISATGPITLSKQVKTVRRNYQPCLSTGCIAANASYLNVNGATELMGLLRETGEKHLYFRSPTIGHQTCTVDESTATVECSSTTGLSSSPLAWFVPTGTIGNKCIRLYDSKFVFGTAGQDSFDEVVMSIGL